RCAEAAEAGDDAPPSGAGLGEEARDESLAVPELARRRDPPAHLEGVAAERRLFDEVEQVARPAGPLEPRDRQGKHVDRPRSAAAGPVEDSAHGAKVERRRVVVQEKRDPSAEALTHLDGVMDVLFLDLDGIEHADDAGLAP